MSDPNDITPEGAKRLERQTGDVVTVRRPAGKVEVTLIAIRY
jgi:hypothetical protein